EVLSRKVRLVLQPLLQLNGDPGFADTWLARQQDHPSRTALSLGPMTHQESHLYLAPNERRAPGAQSLAATLDGSLAQHAPPPQRHGKSLQAHETEVAILEQVAKEALRAGRNHKRVRLGALLKPSRQVRRLADNGRIVCNQRMDELANDHYARGNACPRA